MKYLAEKLRADLGVKANAIQEISGSMSDAEQQKIVSNTLMHREFTSSYAAKLVIKKDQMYTENASRAAGNGFITPENLEPNPKNPLIASFFRNIGRADRLGSGVHKLFKYTKYYSGKDPVFEDGDVFRIVVPLDNDYSFDMEIGPETKRETNQETKRETNRKGYWKVTKKEGHSTP